MVSTSELTAEKLFSVKGFVCVVTGGGTGIGLMYISPHIISLLANTFSRATQTLAANGAKVYITGRRTETLENAAKSHNPTNGEGEIIPYHLPSISCCNFTNVFRIGPCDVTKKEDLESLVSQISSKESHIDLLIAAAGISGPKAEVNSSSAPELKERLFSESSEEWASTFNTNGETYSHMNLLSFKGAKTL
jgi:NAD(P)-dependent dehydrogenase (short-subunit alcohol dehydrogenase family)